MYAYSDVLYDSSVGNSRHFVKDELPRIQYTNPTIAIEVSKIPKAEEDTWQSSLSMEFRESPLAPALIIER